MDKTNTKTRRKRLTLRARQALCTHPCWIECSDFRVCTTCELVLVLS